MPLDVTLKSHPEDHNSHVFRVRDFDTGFYFDVYFIRGTFENSHALTAFVDPVGYNEFNSKGARINLPPTHFQAWLPLRSNDQEWQSLAVSLVQYYLEYRRTGDNQWLIRQMDPTFRGPNPAPTPVVERVSRYERDPVI